MKIFKLILVIALLIVALALIKASKNSPIPEEENMLSVNTQTASIVGCYVARQNKDVYTLKIETTKNKEVSGTLSYQNYEKDSSEGSLKGTFDGEMLVAEYAFRSEGTDSVRQVAFKKTDDGFIQGFGDIEMKDGQEQLKDLQNLNFEHSPEYIEEACN